MATTSFLFTSIVSKIINETLTILDGKVHEKPQRSRLRGYPLGTGYLQHFVHRHYYIHVHVMQCDDTFINQNSTLSKTFQNVDIWTFCIIQPQVQGFIATTKMIQFNDAHPCEHPCSVFVESLE